MTAIAKCECWSCGQVILMAGILVPISFVMAADDLYAAFCESGSNPFQKESLAAFAKASNEWRANP